MVFGGDWPKSPKSASKSSSVSSQMPAVDFIGVLFCVVLLAAGVKTDTPGVRVGFRCGDEKISAWSSGAAGSGEERMESSARSCRVRFRAVVVGVASGACCGRRFV